MCPVWLIEDNAAYRRIIERVFHAHPSTKGARFFGCCEDAIDAIALGENATVILVDIELPGIDGIQGIQRIKQLLPDAHILVLTVFEDDDKIFRAICAGASGYLLKSEPLSRVIEAIDQAGHGGAPMNPRVARRVLRMLTQLGGQQKDYDLNPREQRVLELIVDGLAKKQIADQTGLNPHTVNYIIRCIYRKLHVNCIASAVSVAVKDGIVRKPAK